MITTKKFIKLLACNEEQLDKEIDKMSEKDAKDSFKFMMQFIKKQTEPSEIYKDMKL